MTEAFCEPSNPPTTIRYELEVVVSGRDYQLCETRRNHACPHYDRVHERFLFFFDRWLHTCDAFKRRLEVVQQASSELTKRCEECRATDKTMKRLDSDWVEDAEREVVGKTVASIRPLPIRSFSPEEHQLAIERYNSRPVRAR